MSRSLSWAATVSARATALPFAGPRVREAAQAIAALVAQHGGKPRCVNVGLLKAGKSTLFNALADRPDHFAVGEVRTTVQVQTLDCGSYLLCDTPGLDFGALDTRRAEDALRGADLILFCHALGAGELQALEVEALERIADFLPRAEERSTRIVPVFTKAEQLEPAAQEAVVSTIARQWGRALGRPLGAHFLVASARYFRGRTESRPRLQETSQIPQLRARLEAQSGPLAAQRDVLLQARIDQQLSVIDHELLGTELVVHERIGRANAEAQAWQQATAQRADELFSSLEARRP